MVEIAEKQGKLSELSPMEEMKTKHSLMKMKMAVKMVKVSGLTKALNAHELP